MSVAAVGYLPWYCEGTREGRPLRACLILLASFHSIAGGANKDRISSQLQVTSSAVITLQYLPQSLLQLTVGSWNLPTQKQLQHRLEWTNIWHTSNLTFNRHFSYKYYEYYEWYNLLLPFCGTGFLMLQQCWPSSRCNSGSHSKHNITICK